LKGSAKILRGNCIEVMRAMEPGSVHAVACSPPYRGLRFYKARSTVFGGDGSCEHEWGAMERGARKDILPADESTADRLGVDERQKGAGNSGGRFCLKCSAWLGQLGLQPLHDCGAWAKKEPPCSACYVCALRMVAKELWRVLRDDGVWWLNIADSYASGGRGAWLGYQERMGEPLPAAKPPPGLKPKDLVGIPERVVLALQADGWYWRDRIAWTKGSAMPSSHTDRCTASFEFVYMFAKQERYYYDLEAVKEPVAVPGVSGIPFGGVRRAGGDNPTYSGRDYTAGETRTRRNVWHVNPEGFGLEFCQSCETIYIPSEHKRLRSESRVDPETGNERVIRFCGCGADPEEAWLSHFAVWPTKLVEPMILAGTSAKGCCGECGAPWERVVKRAPNPSKVANVGEDLTGGAAKTGNPQTSKGLHRNAGNAQGPQPVTTGWRPTCDHAGATLVPATVLDPFSGSGTTALVARRLGRNGIGIELSDGYAKLSEERLKLDEKYGDGPPPESVSRAKAERGRSAPLEDFT